jgi:hypothetical protein
MFLPDILFFVLDQGNMNLTDTKLYLRNFEDIHLKQRILLGLMNLGNM